MEIGKIQVTNTSCDVVYFCAIPAGITGATVAIQYKNDIWNGLAKTVVFQGAVTKDIVTDDDNVVVPAETVCTPDTKLRIGVYGVDKSGNVAVPTLWADLGTVQTAADPYKDVTVEASPEVWEQILGIARRAEDTAQGVQKQAEAGEFDGHTPEKGVDYFTEEEVEAVKNAAVVAAKNEIDPILEQAEAAKNSASASASRSEEAAQEALASSNSATSSKLDAENSKDNARFYMNRANSAANSAESCLTNALESEQRVRGYEANAKKSADLSSSNLSYACQYANKAEESAKGAENSANSAAGSAGAAETSADEAGSAAQAAKEAADTSNAAAERAGEVLETIEKKLETGEFIGPRGDALFATLAVDDDGHLHLLGAENTGGVTFTLNEETGNLGVSYG